MGEGEGTRPLRYGVVGDGLFRNSRQWSLSAPGPFECPSDSVDRVLERPLAICTSVANLPRYSRPIEDNVDRCFQGVLQLAMCLPTRESFLVERLM